MSDKLSGRKGIRTLLTEFSNHGRTDCYSAYDIRDGEGYKLRKQKITEQVIDAHAKNEQPIAIYLFKGEFTRLAGLDVDNHGGELEWSELVEKVRPVLDDLLSLGFKPLMVRSGGGAGIHILLAWNGPQLVRRVRRFLAKILARHGLKHGTSGIAEGTIEVYPKANSVPEGKFGSPLALPFARESVPLDVSLQPILLDDYDPPRLVDLYGPPLDDFSDEYFELEKVHRSDVTEESQIPNVVLSGDESEVESALKHIPADDTGDWIGMAYVLKRCFGPEAFETWNKWSATSVKYPGTEECRRVWDDLEPDGRIGIGSLFYMAQQKGWNGPSDPAIREMNAKYGIVTQGNKTMIIEKMIGHDDDRAFSWISKEVLADRYRWETVEVPAGDKGTKFDSIVDYWLRNKRAAHYHRVDFDPSLPPGGNGKIWNIWTGFAVRAQSGDWSLLQDHILHNICGGDVELNAWVLNWMTLGLQEPGEIIGTAIVLSGLPGTGKGILAHAYGSLWGKHYTTITHEAHVTGRFNAHLFGRRFIFVDEGMWGGDRRVAGTLKTRITEKYVTVEAKGIDPIRSRNRSIYMIASNEASIVPADIADRRWQMFEVGNRNREDRAYFGALTDQLENGGREAMLYDLLHRDISSGPDPRRTIKTAGLFEQILRAQGPEFRYIFQILEAGTLPQPNAPGNGTGVTTIQAMYEEMRATQPNAQFVHVQYFGRQLNKIFPDMRTAQNGTYLKGFGAYTESHRSTRYHFPPLSVCRENFKRYADVVVPWSNDLTDWQSDNWQIQEDESPF